MAGAAVQPHQDKEHDVDPAVLSEAICRFVSAGFEVRREASLYRVKKMLRSGDRVLTAAELILLAKHL